MGPSLQLNMKRNESRLKELETRFGATRHTVNKARGAAGGVGGRAALGVQGVGGDKAGACSRAMFSLWCSSIKREMSQLAPSTSLHPHCCCRAG